MIKNAKISNFLLLIAITSTPAFSAVSETEAARLHSELTPLGAERQGNADGSIPAWTGGYTQGAPAGYISGQPRKDLFPNDQVKFSITASNYNNYENRINEGVKVMFEKYPDFRMDIYQTRRTAAAPQLIYENTYKNATSATLSNNGLYVENAFGGVPFPIPKNGYEVMWNHLLSWKGKSTNELKQTWVIAKDGSRVLASGGGMHFIHPYYGQGEWDGNAYSKVVVLTDEPSYKSGEALVAYDTLDNSIKGRSAWQYMPGQRRVRRTPSLGYDTPDFVTSGVAFFDEGFGFSGGMDRYDWKLIGKQEMYIPYNNNRYFEGSTDEVLGPNFINPDYVRWELHRVWVVEANVKSGQRHAMPKRRMYIDEDTWKLVLSDGWDSSGKLWKMTYTMPVVIPEVPMVIERPWGTYDFLKGSYLVNGHSNEGLQIQADQPKPDSFFAPQSLSTGLR